MMRFLVLLMMFSANPVLADVPVWIGMSAPRNGEPEGIYRAVLNAETGELSRPELAARIPSPGFLAISPDGKKLYTVCQLRGDKPGVASFNISENADSLALQSTQPIGDGDACFVAIDQKGQSLFTAQYGTGSIASFPLAPDGKIQPRASLVKHSGSGPNKQRQEAAHPHSTNVDPTNRFVLVPDLGTDKIVVYSFDPASAQLSQSPAGEGIAPPGAGPRHMKFHPNDRYAFVVNELDLSVTAFAYDSKSGALKPLQTVSTLPEDLREVSCTCSEIRIHPSGKFLYAANRGHDSIAAFSIEPDSGRLGFVELESIRGSHPRNFNVDPSGKWLLVAGRDSNTISVFEINPDTGGLVFTGRVVNSPAPICIEFQSKS